MYKAIILLFLLSFNAFGSVNNRLKNEFYKYICSIRTHCYSIFDREIVQEVADCKRQDLKEDAWKLCQTMALEKIYYKIHHCLYQEHYKQFLRKYFNND